MPPPQPPDRTQHLLALVLAVWFAFLALAYHQSFPAGTLPSHGEILAIALLVLASAAGLGLPVVDRFTSLKAGWQIRALLSMGLGLGMMEILVLGLCATGLAVAATGWLLVAAGLVVGGRAIAPRLLPALDAAASGAGSLRDEVRARWWSVPTLALAAGGWLAALGAAFAPAEFYDALIYHLAVPAHLLEHGGLGVIPGNFYSQFPFNQGMLYALGMLLVPGRIESGSLAQVFHLLLGIASILMTWQLGRRHFSPGVGLLAAVLLATVPGVLLVAIYPIADLAVTFYGVLVLALVLEARRAGEEGRAPLLLLAGVFAGLALGVKYTAAVSVCVPAAVWLAWRARRAGAARLVELASFVGGAAAAFAPWAARNIAAVGNPVAPYLASLFGSHGVRLGLAEELTRRLPEGAGVWGVARYILSGPLRATMEPLGAGGYLGVGFLLLLPFVFLVPRPRPAALAPIAVMGLSAVLCWAATVQVTRYLFPALPALCLLAACGGAALVRSASAVRAPLAVCLGWLLLHNVYLFGVLAVTINPYAVSFGVETPESYLSRRVSYYPAAAWINVQLPETARILMIGEGRTYYLDRPVAAATPYDAPPIDRYAERAAAEGRDLAGLLREAGFTHLLVSGPEMARITRMFGRRAYFDDLSPAARGAVADLLRRSAGRTLFERNGVSVMEVPGG